MKVYVPPDWGGEGKSRRSLAARGVGRRGQLRAPGGFPKGR
jgi:hypothetical protein